MSMTTRWDRLPSRPATYQYHAASPPTGGVFKRLHKVTCTAIGHVSRRIGWIGNSQQQKRGIAIADCRLFEFFGVPMFVQGARAHICDDMRSGWIARFELHHKIAHISKTLLFEHYHVSSLDPASCMLHLLHPVLMDINKHSGNSKAEAKRARALNGTG